MLNHVCSLTLLSFLLITPVASAQADDSPAAPFSNHRPMWSPDGKSIIFMSTRDGGENEWELYTMKLDGSELNRLTHHEGWDGYAAYSPDASMIVYDKKDDTYGQRIMIRNMKTGMESVLYDGKGKSTGGGRFSPDGAKIIFFIEREKNREIYKIKPDGSNLTRLTDSPLTEAGGCFSPDGKSITFVTWMNGSTNIERMDSDGSNRATLRKIGGRAYGIDFSPDGRRIVFNSDDNEDDSELYIMNSDGTGLIKLTENDAWDHQPVFSPDGRHLLFSSYRSGVEEIYMMDPDGSNVVRVRTD